MPKGKPNGKTEFVEEIVEDGPGDGGPGDGELEEAQDEAPVWVRFSTPGMIVDVTTIEYGDDLGTDVDGNKVPELRGILLRPVPENDLEAGTEVRVTAGPVKLARLLRSEHRAGNLQPGQRQVIKYPGEVKVPGGKMKDFKVLHGPINQGEIPF